MTTFHISRVRVILSVACFCVPLSVALPGLAQTGGRRPGLGRSLSGDTALPANARALDRAAGPAAKAGPKRVAVMRTLVDGVEAGVGAQISARISEVTRARTGAEVLSAEEIQTLLEHERDKQLTGCEQESCLAEVADALGADTIVQARLSRVDGGYALSVSALDAVSARPIGRVDEQWGGEPLLLLDLIKPAVDRLFRGDGPEPTGVLLVDGVADGSRIIVDDVVRGTAPAGQLALPVGAHRLTVTLEGHESFSKWIILNAGQQSTIPVQQNIIAVDDAAFYQTWWFWTAVGGGVAVAAAGTAGALVLLNDPAGGNPGKTGVNVAVNADNALGGAR